MEHWFDGLARPHTRRTGLKAAVAAGASLLLPVGLPSSASAKRKEACYGPCLQLAQAQQEQDDQACAQRFGTASWAESVPVIGGTLASLRHERWTGCNALASVRWHEEIIRCRFQPACGDPARYPGGQAPTSVPQPPIGGCDPGSVLCGDYCCNLQYATCVGCNGTPICCRIGGNCCSGG
jgi:hypothetical protein